MRPQPFQGHLLAAAHQAPGIEAAATFAERGYTDRTCGVVCLHGGGHQTWWQIVGTYPPTGTPDDNATGPAAPALAPPDPAPGGVSTALAAIERALGAALDAPAHPHYAAVQLHSAAPGRRTQARYGLTVRFHDLSACYAMLLCILRPGQHVAGVPHFRPRDHL